MFYQFFDGMNVRNTISSVIRQKGGSQNGCFKKTKHTKFSKKRTFLTPCYAHVMFVSRKIWRALFSWKTRFEISPFALLPTIYKTILTCWWWTIYNGLWLHFYHSFQIVKGLFDQEPIAHTLKLIKQELSYHPFIYRFDKVYFNHQVKYMLNYF